MQARRSRLIQTVFAMFLFVAAILLGLLGSGLVAGFAMLAALLIGAALALPVILDGLLAAGARHAKSIMEEWFWADTRQQLPGL